MIEELGISILDRRTKENFTRYMRDNPFYFKDAFPGMTIDEAWECLGPIALETMDIKEEPDNSIYVPDDPVCKTTSIRH